MATHNKDVVLNISMNPDTVEKFQALVAAAKAATEDLRLSIQQVEECAKSLNEAMERSGKKASETMKELNKATERAKAAQRQRPGRSW